MRRYLLLFFIAIIAVVYFLFLRLKEADFEFVGRFGYEITDEKLLNETYLSSDSYGYLIGDLPIQGLRLDKVDSISSSKEYIFSKDRPLKAVFLNSSFVKNEGQTHMARKPVEIVQDTTTLDKGYLYIYELKPAGKYRLLLP